MLTVSKLGRWGGGVNMCVRIWGHPGVCEGAGS